MKPYYDHAGIVIYNADCREVLPGIPKADLLLTDPPYGLGKKLHDGGTWSTDPKYDAMLEWDLEPIENDFMLSLVATYEKAIVWGGNYYSLPPSRCWLAWVKNNNVPTMADFELAWTNFDRPSKKCQGNVHPDGVNRHPTQKPLYLMRYCITFASPIASLIDPFSGVGSSLRAAKDMGIPATGCEISEKYCEIAAERLSQEVFDFEAGQ